MKRLILYTTLFVTFFSNLYAYDLSKIKDANISEKEKKTLKIPKHTHESRYDRFERKLSKYKGSLLKDMATYSADIFIPDEMITAVKDVIDNRDDKGFGNKSKHIFKILGNDAYNIALTTAYYYMQDMARISERVWEDAACNPKPFEYDIRKEPKVPLLDLKENDPNARGVSDRGIVLPVNENFPKALYPYAARPDGCSAEGFQNQYNQLNDISDDDKGFREACNEHDRCYYTIGTTMQDCNSRLIVDIIDSCNQISGKKTLKYLGMKNAFCGMKGWAVATGADACARKYYAHAQKKQKVYEQWIMRYEKAYLEAKKSQTDKKKGH